jgi:hypothetical protein
MGEGLNGLNYTSDNLNCYFLNYETSNYWSSTVRIHGPEASLEADNC